MEGISNGKTVDMMLAKKHDPTTQDPTGWLISEKLDGVRCFWNGTQMLTRNGNLFYPPDWFIKELPKDLALDGELFTTRDDFQKIVSIVCSVLSFYFASYGYICPFLHYTSEPIKKIMGLIIYRPSVC